MSETRDPGTDQRLPMPNASRPIADLVREDIQARKAHGIRKYGTALQAHNGRSATRDAYEEAVDLTKYLRQKIEEETSEARSVRVFRYRDAPRVLRAACAFLRGDAGEDPSHLVLVPAEVDEPDGYEIVELLSCGGSYLLFDAPGGQGYAVYRP